MYKDIILCQIESSSYSFLLTVCMISIRYVLLYLDLSITTTIT